MPEREMTDMIGSPIFKTHFPAEMDVFYMKCVAEDRMLTRSLDLVMIGVGEIIGGSMRIDDFDKLIAACKANKTDPTPYFCYTDHRKYGTCPHKSTASG